jgi:Uma2 family endonuclease
MSTQPRNFLTPEEYLEIERKAEFRSEYYNGEMFPMDRAEPETTDMAGAREVHSSIIWNFGGELRAEFKSGPCRGYSHDMRVRVSATGLYTYPDIVVVCGERQFLDERHDTVLNPTLIVEVLSPSTEAYDRGWKFEHYRSLSSLKCYVLVATDRIHVDCYTRQPGDQWLLTSGGKPEETITLEAINCQIKLADLYEGVELLPAARPSAASR